MDQKRLALAGACILLISAAIILAFSQNSGKGKSQVCFRDSCFYVEIAITPEQQARGLMFRTSLEEDEGMLFIFQEEGIYPFWMKNTLIPLDIIWMDSNRIVVFIGKDEQPCGPEECTSINPEVPAKYVLEVNAGTVEGLGLEEGEKLDFDLAQS